METKTLIQASAQIMTLVNIKKGDIYKRFQASTYSGGDDKLFYGTVLDVMHNGEEAVISAVEFDGDYSGTSITHKVFGGNRELQLFPATVEEMQFGLQHVIESGERAVESARVDLEKKQVNLAKAVKAANMQLTEADVRLPVESAELE